jgi:hypothetical protein
VEDAGSNFAVTPPSFGRSLWRLARHSSLDEFENLNLRLSHQPAPASTSIFGSVMRTWKKPHFQIFERALPPLVGRNQALKELNPKLRVSKKSDQFGAKSRPEPIYEKVVVVSLPASFTNGRCPRRRSFGGFERIGRLVFGAIVEQGLLGKDRDAEALNNPVPVDDLAYLRKYDSTQGRFSGEVTVLKHSAER